MVPFGNSNLIFRKKLTSENEPNFVSGFEYRLTGTELELLFKNANSKHSDTDTFEIKVDVIWREVTQVFGVVNAEFTKTRPLKGTR